MRRTRTSSTANGLGQAELDAELERLRGVRDRLRGWLQAAAVVDEAAQLLRHPGDLSAGPQLMLSASRAAHT